MTSSTEGARSIAAQSPPAAQPWKVLIADDDKAVHALTKLALGGTTFHGRPLAWLHAYSGEEAVRLVREHPDIALVLMDVIMEDDSAGLDAVQRIREELGNTLVRIAVRTGQHGVVREESIVRGYLIDDYREKDELNPARLFTLVHTSLAHYEQLRTLEAARARLHGTLEAAGAQGPVPALNGKEHEMVVTLSEAIEARSPETGNHVRRVAEYARLLGQLAGLDAQSTHLLYLAAPLHDAGKIGIPDAVLHKPGAHTEAESEVMRTHAELGRRLFARPGSPVLEAAAIVAGEHHERWDGRGYPNGMRGEQIHVYGRITALVDVFDALIHPRCYKDAWPLHRALDYIVEQSGHRFDPALVELFMQHLDRFLEIHERLRERAAGVP